VEERPEPRHRRVAVLLVQALYLLPHDLLRPRAALGVVVQLQTTASGSIPCRVMSADSSNRWRKTALQLGSSDDR
jgi:hypothetical protein